MNIGEGRNLRQSPRGVDSAMVKVREMNVLKTEAQAPRGGRPYADLKGFNFYFYPACPFYNKVVNCTTQSGKEETEETVKERKYKEEYSSAERKWHGADFKH